MELGNGLRLPDAALEAICRRHGIRRLSLFGSVLGSGFANDSDVDVLVEFAPGRVPGLLGLSQIELELEGLLGRRVDLRTYGDLSRYFRDDVVATSREIYAA